MDNKDKPKDTRVFIPRIVLDEEGEEVYYELAGSKCSRCPLKGLCG